MKYIIFIYLCMISQVSFAGPDFIVEIFRHGIRAPQNTTYDPGHWNPSDAGQLTPGGMRMHYILGESLANNYSNLFFPYSPASIYVRSTNYNRTIMSAYSQLYGIYQNQGINYNSTISTSFNMPPYNQNWTNLIYDDVDPNAGYLPFKIQPVPVHEVESSDETLLFNGPQTCPSAAAWENGRMNDTNSYAIWKYLEENQYIEYYNMNNCTVNSLTDVWLLGDTIVSNYYSNITLPCNIKYLDEVYNVTVFAFEWYTNYVYVGTDEQLALFSTDILLQLYSWFEEYTNGTNNMSAILLSGHDTTLLTVLGAFNLTYPDCLYQNYLNGTNQTSSYFENCIYPTFASRIVFELYNESNPYLLFYFNDLALPICGSDTSNNCTLELFYEYVQNVTIGFTMEDFDRICGLQPENPSASDNYSAYCIGLGAFLIIEFMIAILLFIKRRRQYRSTSNKIENSSGYMKV